MSPRGQNVSMPTTTNLTISFYPAKLPVLEVSISGAKISSYVHTKRKFESIECRAESLLSGQPKAAKNGNYYSPKKISDGCVFQLIHDRNGYNIERSYNFCKSGEQLIKDDIDSEGETTDTKGIEIIRIQNDKSDAQLLENCASQLDIDFDSYKIFNTILQNSHCSTPPKNEETGEKCFHLNIYKRSDDSEVADSIACPMRESVMSKLNLTSSFEQEDNRDSMEGSYNFQSITTVMPDCVAIELDSFKEIRPFKESILHQSQIEVEPVEPDTLDPDDESCREAEDKPLSIRDAEEIFSHFTELDKLQFDKVYTKRKIELEMQAESRAKFLSAKWTKEGRSLKTIIDDSLKEYIEVYEMAHALRLQFEAEKESWKKTVVEMMRKEAQANISDSRGRQQPNGHRGCSNGQTAGQDWEFYQDDDNKHWDGNSFDRLDQVDYWGKQFHNFSYAPGAEEAAGESRHEKQGTTSSLQPAEKNNQSISSKSAKYGYGGNQDYALPTQRPFLAPQSKRK